MSAKAKAYVTPAFVAGVASKLEAAEAKAGSYFDNPRDWHERHRKVMQELADELVAAGATVRNRWDGAHVKIGGISASSTSGIAGALHNWLKAAQKRIASTAAENVS